MSFPVENRQKAIQYALVWVVYALLHALSMQWIVELPFELLLLDALIHAALFALIGIVLWNVVFYGNYDKMPFIQRFINYSSLALLSVSVWVGLGYGLDYLFFDSETLQYFIPILPLYVFIGFLVYLIMMLYFRNKLTQMQQNMDGETEIETSEQEEIVEAPEDEPNQEQELIERIAVKSGQKIHVILVPEILYLQADGDYVHIITTNGKYLKEQTMKFFDDGLPESQFVRVHRSYIVNIEAISRIELYEKQSQLLTIKNGDKIRASAAGYKLLRNKLGL